MSNLVQSQGTMGVWGWRLFVNAIINEDGGVCVRDMIMSEGFHAVDKDFTDTEKAVKYIMSLGQDGVRVMGLTGSIYWDSLTDPDEYFPKYTGGGEE